MRARLAHLSWTIRVVTLLLLVTTTATCLRSIWFADQFSASFGHIAGNFCSFKGWFSLDLERTATSSPADFYHLSARRADIDISATPNQFRFRLLDKPYMGLVWIRPLLNIDVQAIFVIVLTALLFTVTAFWPYCKRGRPKKIGQW